MATKLGAHGLPIRKPAAGGPTPSVAFGSEGEDGATASSYSIAGLSFGAVAGPTENTRYIVAACMTRQTTGAVTHDSCTIGGITATKVTDGTTPAEVAGSNSGGHCTTSLWIAAVPTGTSGTVALTISANALRCSIATFRLVDPDGAQADEVFVSSMPGTPDPQTSGAFNIPANGMVIANAADATGNSSPLSVWTNLTKRYDVQVEAVSQHTGGCDIFPSGDPSRTITVSMPTPSDQAACFASWAPAV